MNVVNLKTMIKTFLPFLILLCVSTAASVPDAEAQDSAAGSLTRFKPALLNVNPEEEAAPKPLATIISAVEVSVDPAEIRLDGLRGLVVSVHNGTDQPLVVQGESAEAMVNGAAFHAATTGQIDKAALPWDRRRRKIERATADIALAALTVGAYQAARDESIQKGPVLGRYGDDEIRRTQEVESFGNRVIWPGQTRKGILYFISTGSLRGASLKIPMQEAFDPTNSAVFTSRF